VIDIDIEELQVWARECGDIALRLFNRVKAQRKADNSPVTEADVTIERMLVERLTQRYPDHGIIGEEQTRIDITKEYVWALDPIDGTASFVAGLPVWGISIGLLHRGVPCTAGGVGVTLSGVPLDNAALLEGRVTREPLLFGAPGTVEALRCRIRARR
jgi:fructose-1,6-bisphosphatase/inositol monophosphatase family enzyme